MPVYPCQKCNSPVDPTSDRICKNCREAKPLLCSRCQKRISTEEVYGVEKMKTAKPIFCLECGVREEVVKCAMCNLSLQRHQGVSVSAHPLAKLYHPKCLQERQKQMVNLEKFRPIMAIMGVIVGGLGGYGNGGPILAAVGAIALGGALFALVQAIRNRINPG